MTGFTVVRVMKYKNAATVAHNLGAIIRELNKINKVRTVHSDLGSEFYNKSVAKLLNTLNIIQIKPRKIKINPIAENRVKVVKRYVRINSALLHQNKWFRVVDKSVHAVNNIRRAEGYTPQQLLDAFKKGKHEILG